MPRYFFHLICSDGAHLADDEGILFEGDALARREGLASLGELVRDAARSGRDALNLAVEIVREDGSAVAVLAGDLAGRPLQP